MINNWRASVNGLKHPTKSFICRKNSKADKVTKSSIKDFFFGGGGGGGVRAVGWKRFGKLCVPLKKSRLAPEYITAAHLLLSLPFIIIINLKYAIYTWLFTNFITGKDFYKASRPLYWFTKTVKQQLPCWRSKPILWELNLFLKTIICPNKFALQLTTWLKTWLGKICIRKQRSLY